MTTASPLFEKHPLLRAVIEAVLEQRGGRVLRGRSGRRFWISAATVFPAVTPAVSKNTIGATSGRISLLLGEPALFPRWSRKLQLLKSEHGWRIVRDDYKDKPLHG